MQAGSQYLVASDARYAFRYEDSAQRIQRRMEQLRLDLRTADDPDSARQLRRRLTELQPMLRQCRQLARLTAHYYDRSDRSYDPFRL